MKPFHIAMMIGRFTPCRGGIELFCERLAQRLNERGHRLTILTERYQSDLPVRESLNGLQIIRFPVWGKPPLSSLFFLVQGLLYLARNRSIQVLHGFLFSSTAILCILAERLTSRPAVVTMGGARQTGDIEVSRHSMFGLWKLKLIRRMLRHACCPGEETAQELRSLGMDHCDVHLIPNGIDTAYFRPASGSERSAARQRLGFHHQKKTALFVGRYVDGKGVDRLLQTWTLGLHQPVFEWDLRLVIPGNNPLKSSDQTLVNDSHGRIRVDRNVEDPRLYYHAADLAILLSEGEGLSLFLLEAMACGLPAIVTEAAAVGLPPDNQKWCMAYPIDRSTPQHIYDQLQAWSVNPEIFQEMSSAARTKALTFDLDLVVNAYEKIYQNIAASTQP